MDDRMYQMIHTVLQKGELNSILACNERTKKFGLTLTQEEAKMLVQCRRETLAAQRRVEFGEGILKELIDCFCDSQYLTQDEFAAALAQLQEIFYLYKNESEDNLTDDELLSVMKEMFEGICFGDINYLKETCLERFARAIRAGYRDYEKSGGIGEAERFSEEARWDSQLYLDTLFDQLS